ncbi:hypothetical protein EPA93_18180 [Ktedonosporobacter rubrisoli]|uniref:ParB-like N-terminal domain-containing protein n=1 Tax=Ktedonosporobacter rubrisoli TaxID=2509675 RepID=A0A4P6JQV3_KTERU|nr:ParB N-terminal domain-containing protein [Ktedonosporobacter rubrisoli]QBD77817.1 hypothetical protein EPA93_18180 [Ktedonosporobacter rubrisoli]
MAIQFITVESEKILPLPIEKGIPLGKSAITNAAVATRPLDQEHLAHLLEVPSEQLPPIEVVLIFEGYIIIDGHHRFERAKRKGETTIAAIARNYQTEYEVVRAAFLANLAHGLPANQLTRTAFGIWLHITPDPSGKQLSIREAAKLAGIHHSGLAKALKKLQEQNSLELEPIPTEPDEETIKQKAVTVQTEKLAKNISSYFSAESKFSEGDLLDSRLERMRAQNLARYFQQRGDTQSSALLLRALARSLNKAADTLQKKDTKKG